MITAPTCKRWRADQRCRASACWRASPLERPGRTLLVVMLLMMRMLLEQMFLKEGEEKVEEHKVHLVDHHLAGEATVQLEPG